ncbi:transporter substrate-binding domain-containing protein [Rhizobium sp. ARZ01]|uniref:transporter substrate-binding domain-containing protein n=1 Tax=Rhizobium sp. ARZ01 TaxID=2769313 RepID=UPI00178635D6|nr:transporter substrate-binding domain-containing protein [Rhizobium sp. ARZ01]MBD9374084.1 transporter substrate-binding domain-containing protein [Rhizobium sp. ARZ01]
MSKAVPVVLSLSMLALADPALAEAPSFVADGTVGVCTTAAFPPLTFKQQAGDAIPVGIDIDIAEALAKKWNASTTYTTTDFAGLLPTLGSGRCGLIISGIYINDERRKTYDGARYMKSATVLVTKADNAEIATPENLSGRTIALESGAYYKEDRVKPLNEEFVAGGRAEVSVQDYPTQQAAYQQVLVGRADATLTEEAEGAYRVATTENQFKIAYTWQSDFTYGIYMRRSADDLGAVRKALKELRQEGFFEALAKKYGLDPSVFDVDHDA